MVCHLHFTIYNTYDENMNTAVLVIVLTKTTVYDEIIILPHIKYANLVCSPTTHTVCLGLMQITFLVIYGFPSNNNSLPMVVGVATGLVA